MSQWNEFLQSESGQSLVPARKHDNVSTYFQIESDEYECDQTADNEREEWMFLAELNPQRDQLSDINSIDIPSNYWHQHDHCYTQEQIDSMTSWIENQKEQYQLNVNKERDIDIASFNDAQHLAYSIVFDHYLQEKEDQLLLIITGLAGSGKSYLIYAIKNLVKENCKVCSYFGTAAYNIKGKT